MIDFKDLRHSRVFEIFEDLSRIPRGSGNRSAIADFCATFAKKNSLRYIVDDAKNVIIYKDASHGCEKDDPVILQGHLDMVCQKTPECDIDFEKDGITLVREGDILRADRTTLGADNGIAVAMTLSILERNDLKHPPIEAVFTADEEIGMLGAGKIDTSLLRGTRFINLDTEEDDNVTVSCAGGSDFRVSLPLNRTPIRSAGVTIEISGLKGGHSGVEIASHRVNAAMLAGRILDTLSKKTDFSLISLNSGNKPNAIPNAATIALACQKPDVLIPLAEESLRVIQKEIAHETEFTARIVAFEHKECLKLDKNAQRELIYALACSPNGVIEMSAEIEGLVETSLNLGILSTYGNEAKLCYALRSNKASALIALEEKMKTFFSAINAKVSASGHYAPWEFKKDNQLTTLFVETYRELVCQEPRIIAIHAGLECAVFSSALKDADCISIGPNVYDAHTVLERVSIASVHKSYDLLLRMLEKLAK